MNIKNKTIHQLKKLNKRAHNLAILAEKRIARAKTPEIAEQFSKATQRADEIMGEVRVESWNRNIGQEPVRCSLPKKKVAKVLSRIKEIISAKAA